MVIFRTRLKEYRARNNMRQSDLALFVGKKRETIVRVENGKYIPSLKLAMDISNIFGCSVEELFYFEEISKEE